MALIRRDFNDPFEEFERSMRQMRERMRALMKPSLLLDGDLLQNDGADLLAVDMTSDDRHIIVRTAVPGFKEDEIKVDVRGNVLTISAESKTEREDKQMNWHISEMRYGRCARSVVLPEEVVTDKAEATLENGILTVKLPKQKENPVQRIMVKAKKLLTGGKE